MLWELMHAESGRVGAGLHPPTEALSRRKPAAVPGTEELAHGERLRKSAADLQAVDAAAAQAFQRWARGLQDQAAILEQPLTQADLELVDAVVGEALRSSAFRRSFTDFLVEHAPRDHHLDGSPDDEGFQRIAGDARTAYARMLEHRLMGDPGQDEALRLLLDALRDPRLGLSRDTLLHERPATGGPERIWPPLRAYVVLHDPAGSAAQEEAADLAAGAFEQAQQGRIDEAAAIAQSEAAQAHANGVTDQRARALLEDWGFGPATAADGAHSPLRASAGT
ncbi:HpaF protein [Paracidovorax avenae]|uniref:HpaF protein n=1 Tax=Paracidovorax avenae TaxID=80867 RepID=UPI000D205DE1|nr:HpaF protein [Paracidovorax avenae]AVS96840.1 HpaF protein [Paracidovorax avenae]AVT03950.1 HpaF protein [Paracidovorax avenae]AVT10860.1 HpaF protein [Paracidovorax avenae]